MAIRAVLFDVFGTLLDVQSVWARADQLFPGNGAQLARLWREKQIEYTRLRTISSRYVSFTRVTEDALQFACDSLALPLDAAARGMLMHEYTQLDPFPDVIPSLKRLEQAGMTMGVLSNGDPGLLDDVLHGAGLTDFFDVVLSADQVHAFKTAPAVYELGPLTLKHPASEIVLVSSNAWDAIGAKWYGYVSFWVNRSGGPLDRLGERPDAIGKTLDDAASFILQSTRK
ncbi:MAG: haloacid dehalogenase type II [Gemmatimonadota bacterium]